MPHNFAADSFHTKFVCNFVADFLRDTERKPAKNGHFAFLGPFGGLEAGHDVNLRLIGKRVVDFPILVVIELFSLAVMLVELRVNKDWKAPF